MWNEPPIRETAEAETVPAVEGHRGGAAIEEAMGCILSRLIPLKGAPVGDDRIGTRKANPSAGGKLFGSPKAASRPTRAAGSTFRPFRLH